MQENITASIPWIMSGIQVFYSVQLLQVLHLLHTIKEHVKKMFKYQDPNQLYNGKVQITVFN